MKKNRGKQGYILTWLIGASLTLAPVVTASSAMAAQAQNQSNDQSNQQGDQGQGAPPPPDNGQAPPPSSQNQQSGQQGQWGPAGPPPDAQNGQIPPEPQEQDQPQDQDQGPPPDNGQAPPPGQSPDQGGYGQGSYGPGGYAPPSQYPQQNHPALPTSPVALPAGTLVPILTSEPLDTKKLHVGDFFQGTLARGIFLGNMLVVPRGAQVVGHVVDLRKPGNLKGSAKLALAITNLNLSGQSYPLASNVWSVKSPGKGGYTAGNAIGGAVLGSVIGAIAGGGPGAAIGAAAGTGVGLGASAATPGPRNVIPPESLLTFRLTAPITVNPVTYQEVQELEENAPRPPQPRYRPRYGYPPPPGYYPPPPPPPYGYRY